MQVPHDIDVTLSTLNVQLVIILTDTHCSFLLAFADQSNPTQSHYGAHPDAYWLLPLAVVQMGMKMWLNQMKKEK